MKEKDIRPAELFNKYLELCSKDAKTFFKNIPKYDIPCPACNQSHVKNEFRKWGFNYVSCQECHSLFQSPRPEKSAFDYFYLNSPSSKYWAKTFFPTVVNERKNKLFKPKVEKIYDLFNQWRFEPKVIADIGAGYGLFLDEWRSKSPNAKLIAIEPNDEMANICLEKEFEVHQSFIENISNAPCDIDFLVAFEVIEHIHDPFHFCKALKRMISSKGKVLITGLTVDGFDIQVLWENSNSISPPHHLNFLSIKGINELLIRSGFSSVRISTPGKLDVDIVKNAIQNGVALTNENRFVGKLMNCDESTLIDFQSFLSKNCLSSHFWCWAS